MYILTNRSGNVDSLVDNVECLSDPLKKKKKNSKSFMTAISGV